jgi:hypothetical protein
MGVRNKNSTAYEHPDEPNLLNLHKAMEYNLTGQPVLRAHIDGVTLQGDVLVDAVKLWDGTDTLEFEAPNNDGEPGQASLPAEAYNMVFNGSTWDRMRGNVNDGVLAQISNDYLAISKDTNANSDSNRIYVNASGTVELGTTTLAALETITVNQGTAGASAWKVDIGDSGTVTADVTFPTIYKVSKDTNDNTSTNPIYITGNVTTQTTGSTLFGEPYAIPLVPVIQINSYEGIRLRDAQVFTGGGGSVEADESSILVSCTSTLGSYGVYRSQKFIPYNVGQSNIARILAKFGTPVAGTSQRIGVGNQENGYFIGYSGSADSGGAATALKFLHMYGGKAETWELELTNTANAGQTVTLVLNSVTYTISIANNDTAAAAAAKITAYLNANSSNAWICDQIDNRVVLLSGSVGNLTGTFSYASTGNITGTVTVKYEGLASTNEWKPITLPANVDLERYNQWQFQYNWTGVVVTAQNQTTGLFELVYRHTLATDDITELPVAKPAFKVTTVCYNVGGAAGTTLYIAGLFGGIEGEQVITKYTNGGANTQSSLASGTYWHIMSIQNPYVDPDTYKLNFRSIEFLDLVASVQCNDPVQIFIYFNQPKATGYNFNFTPVTGRSYQADLTNGVFNVALDSPVVSVIVGINGTLQFELKDYHLIAQPGTHMSLVAYSTASINKVTISGVWRTMG